MTQDQAIDTTKRIQTMFEEYDDVPWQVVIVCDDEIALGGSMSTAGKLAVIKLLSSQLFEQEVSKGE